MELLKAIQTYTGYEINILDLDRSAYRETLRLAEEDQFDLKALMEETEKAVKRNRGKKKGKVILPSNQVPAT